MEGLLEGACVLGVCKLACSLFFLPAFSGLISFCFCCLLMFTDLVVTGFLLFLWLADPWPPQLSPHRDLIALRFLLFLGHTYTAALLLTTPLVAAETALRKLWPCDGAACPGADGVALECGIAVEQGDARPPGTDADRGRDKWRRVSHAVGYPCCLSVWMVSGLWVGFSDRSLEELWAAACLHTGEPLVACLPRMLPSPVDPVWGVALLSLLLLLLLAVELAARVRQEKHNMGAGVNSIGKSNTWPHLVPALVRPSSPTAEPWLLAEPDPRCVDPEKTSGICLAPTALRWIGEQLTAHWPHPVPPPAPPAPGEPPAPPAPGEPRRGPNGAGQETAEGGPGPARCPRGPGPRRAAPGPGLMVTTGLVGVLSLCTLPASLGVNVLLVQTMRAVVEGCVDTRVARRRRRRGEATSNVSKT